MQKVQNTGARLILRAPRYQNCIPLPQQLHCLPISKRIKYKTACMCYNAITGSAPSYLSELLHLYSPSRSLRSSSDTGMLKLPKLQPQNPWLSHFFTFWPHIWNTLPQDIRRSATLSSFKKSSFMRGQWPKWINHPFPYLFLQRQTQNVTFFFSEYFS